MGGKTDKSKGPQPSEGPKLGEFVDPSGRTWPNEAAYQKNLAVTEQKRLDRAKAVKVKTDKQALATGQRDLVSNAILNPKALVTSTDVNKIPLSGDQVLGSDLGQAGEAAKMSPTDVGTASQVVNPANIATSTMTVESSLQDMQGILGQVQGAEGTLNSQALIESVVKDPSQLAQLGLSPAQVTQIQQVLSPEKLQVSDEMLVNGSSVDMAEVESIAQVQAAQADPSKAATVRGQLEELYTDFDGTNPPAWASGAMRAATAKMAQRGLAASSMAGQAIVQAAMESALPIAMADAQTIASFESQNLSHRQQAAMFGAQQRAEFLKMDFDQAFQSRVVNASRISDVAHINFTADQQIALENARLAQSTDIANLSSRSAKIISDAAAMSQMELSNLSNQQRVLVENAKSFLQMDLTNLNNQQQVELFKAQALQQSLLTDTAASNAASQFNASSENQTSQFMASLKSRIDEFNVAQSNAMEQFNINEDNATEQFNAVQDNMRDQFNAQNSLIIAQANAKWRQDVVTIDTATQNEANMDEARTANTFTAKTLDEIWQRERDLMQYAFVSSESEKERAIQLTLQGKKVQAENSAALGGILAKLVFGGVF